MKSDRNPTFFQRLTGFDYFVFAGALMNIIVVVYLLGYWLVHG